MAGDCRNVMVQRQVERNDTCCERSFLLEGALLWNPQAGIERWESSYVSRYEKKLKDKLDDEIKQEHMPSREIPKKYS